MADDQWVRLDGGRNVVEAALVGHALERAGIAFRKSGENTASLAGPLPVNESIIELWVPEQLADRARRVLFELQTSPVDVTELPCPYCGEVNPRNFDLCWSCHAEIKATAGLDSTVRPAEPQRESVATPDTSVSSVTPAVPEPTRQGGSSSRMRAVAVITWAAAFVIVIGIGTFGFRAGQADVRSRLQMRDRMGPLFWRASDREGCSTQIWRESDIVRARVCDKDTNGVHERNEVFDARGRLVTVYTDDDQNGISERMEHFAPNGRASVSTDADQDGRFEAMDATLGDGTKLHLIDADEDGIFERVQVLDSAGHIVREQVLSTTLGYEDAK